MGTRTKATTATAKIDPLFVIFEKQLFQFHDADQDRGTFVKNVVSEYLAFLRRSSIAVPRALESAVFEELEAQVHVMLTKKMYGCLSLTEYREKTPDGARKAAAVKYKKAFG